MSYSSKPLVDPELIAMIEAIAPIELDVESLPAIREQSLAAVQLVLPPLPASVERRSVSIASADGLAEIELVIFTPEGESKHRPALFHIHGGGMIMGTTDIAWMSLANPVQSNNAVAISVAYRLAPEAPFPAPIEDCYSGLQWVVEHAEELGIDTNRIAVLGESAGGGLAAALALLARDRGGPGLSGQVLTYPMLDCRTGTDEEVAPNPYAGEFIWNRASNRFGWDCLRGDYDPVDERAGHFSPALAENLENLPPAYISTGSLDLFVGENLDYARRLMTAGVPVELHVYPGAPHGFDGMADAPVSRQALTDRDQAIARFLR